MKRPNRTPNSLKPLQAIQHAEQFDKSNELRDALYVAYWEKGEDIGQLPVLQEIVEAQGIQWEPLAEALAESKYLDTVLSEYQQGLDFGFDGIPAFIIGDVKFTGAQPMEIFRQLADRAQGMLDADPEAFSGRRVL
jgi:predicted DsbA family dithiol-disulfide isomerase